MTVRCGNARKGTSLIELILIILFLSIAIPAILYSMSYVLEMATINNDDRYKAAFLAQSKMEEVISEDFTASEDIYDPDAYYPGFIQDGTGSLPDGLDGGGRRPPGPGGFLPKRFRIVVTTKAITDGVGELNLRFRDWDVHAKQPGGSVNNFRPDLQFTRYKVVVSKYTTPTTTSPVVELNMVR